MNDIFLNLKIYCLLLCWSKKWGRIGTKVLSKWSKKVKNKIELRSLQENRGILMAKIVGIFRRPLFSRKFVGISDGIPTTSDFLFLSEIGQNFVQIVRRLWRPSESPSEFGVFSCSGWSYISMWNLEKNKTLITLINKMDTF